MILFGTVEPADAVRFGRESLDRWWGYPWYDPGADSLHRIDVSKPWWFDWIPDWQSFQIGRWPNDLLEWAAWIGLAVGLGLLIWALVRTYRSRSRNALAGGRRTPAGSDSADERRRVDALPIPAAGSDVDFLSEADRYYREGHYGTAVLYLFSYQLIQLDRHQRIRLARGKTNRQYLRELGARTALGRLLEQTMIAFEDVFFGQHAIDRTRFEACWSRLGEFESLAAEAAG